MKIKKESPPQWHENSKVHRLQVVSNTANYLWDALERVIEQPSRTFYVVMAYNKMDVAEDARQNGDAFTEIRIATDAEIKYYQAHRTIENVSLQSEGGEMIKTRTVVFNINDEVYVKLTDAGKKIYHQQYGDKWIL